MEIAIFIIIIIILIVYIIAKQMDSHDKRLTQIINVSIKHGKQTNGEEFNIKPIKFSDELKRNRYRDSNYEEREKNKIVIKRYINEESHEVYRIDIINQDGKALIYAEFIENI